MSSWNQNSSRIWPEPAPRDARTMNIEELVNELFEEFDENGDGVISRREFVALVESLLDKQELGFSSNIFKR